MYSFRTLALASLATLAVAAPAAALEPLGSQFRVSDADPQYGADFADIAYDPERGRYLTVWQADKAGEDEIWGRLIAADGTPLGAEFRISDMGPEGDAAFGARAPAVTYNPDEDEYLVVWHGDDDTGLLVADEFEIFAQRLSADGAEVGKNDMRVSEMGPDGSVAYWGRSPDVSYASSTNRYLVVWSATDSSVYVAPKELEIYGQALDADGTEIGPDDQRLSEAGVEGDPDHDADYPAVAYSPQQDEHLVVWNGDLKDGSVEIIGQRVTSGGLPTGVGDVRISDMGPENDSSYTGTRPDVAHNPRRDEYLVVWEGDDDGPLLVDDEREIFAQRFTATGTEIGPNDLRVSSAGPDGDASFLAGEVRVAYGYQSDEYVLAWEQEDDTPPLVEDEYEIYARRLGSDAAQPGPEVRISHMGPDGSKQYDAGRPAIAAGPGGAEFLVAWRADDDNPPLMDNELEIFARRARIAGADGGESQPPPVDTTPPGLRLQTRPRQRLRRDRTVVLRATCDESCTLSPRVTITIAGRRRAIRRTGIVRPLAGAATTPIRLRLRRKQAAAVRRALRRGRRATATFHAKAIDAAGNGASKRARSRLIRAGSAGVR